MTISEIARALNISKTAVSFCLNGRAREFGLRPELEEQVKKYAEEHGYHPNMAARKLRSSAQCPPVGILFANEGAVSKFANTFREVFSYLNSIHREYIFMGTEVSMLGNTMQLLRSMDVNDVLVIGLTREPDPSDKTPNGIIANQQWAKVRLMLENGMRLYLANYAYPLPENSLTGNIFRAGYNRSDLQRDFLLKVHAAGLGPVALSDWTHHESQLPPDALQSGDIVIPVRWNDQCQGGVEAANYILEARKKQPIRTVFISNVISAVSMTSTLTDAGLRVPEDIAVAAFGDNPLADAVRPTITTVGSPKDDKTMDMLRHICGEISDLPQDTVIQYSYQIRQSLSFQKN